MGKKINYGILSIIFIYATYIRFYHLGDQSFWIDEGFSGIRSLSMLSHNMLPFLGNQVNFANYLHLLFQVVSYKILGISDFSSRFFSVIFNILSGVILFLFSKDLFQEENKKHSIIGAIGVSFLFLFSNWEITWARQARFYSLLGFLFLFIVYNLYKYFILNNKKSFKYLVISLSIGLVFHPFIRSLLVVFFIFTLIKYYNEDIIYNEYKYELKWTVLGILLFFIQKSIIFLLSHNISFLSSSSINNNLFLEYSKMYHYHLISQLGIIYVLFFIGLIWLFFKNLKKALFFSLIFSINFYFITHKGFLFHSRYMFHLYPIIILIGTYPWFLIAINFHNHKNRIIQVISIIFSIFIIANIYNNYKFSIIPKENYYIDFTSPQPDFKSAYKFLQKNNYTNIIAGFPHMCVWYNLQLSKQLQCKYGLKIDITGYQKTRDKLNKLNKEIYTNIDYFSGTNIQGYYVVLDELSLKGALDRNFINEVQRDCNLIWQNGKDYNFIGIRNCK